MNDQPPIQIKKVFLPILIGIAVVGYLIYTQFDGKDLESVPFPSNAGYWILASFALLIVRHLSYAYRLRVLSEGVFSWKKCIELIFIWEFSSAVSPSSVGGSAVAFYVLSKESLSSAKTATIVTFTIILDSLFFVTTIPILYMIFGEGMIRPDLSSSGDWGWTTIFWSAYALMFTYGSIMYWGVLLKPKKFYTLLTYLSNRKWLKKYKEKISSFANEMLIAAKELQQKPLSFKFKAFLGTAGAWTCRFLLLNLLVIAFSPDISLDWFTQGQLYARLKAMFVLIGFSPTPGGAGFVELLFNGFVKDMIPSPSHGIVISTVWRLFTYYLYLLIGAIVVPNWIAKLKK